jgi:advillin
MLQVKSYGPLNIKAVQVDFKSSALNSNDVFIVCSRGREFYIWCGKGSTGDEREAAKLMLCAQKREPEMVIESQERDEFWAALGGKQPYHSEKRLQFAAHTPVARLFEVSNSSGKVNVSEIFQFTQDDLSPTDVMILDMWDSVFIWIGASKTSQASNSLQSFQNCINV